MGKLVTKRGGAGRGGSASGRHFTSGYPYASSARAQAAAAGGGGGFGSTALTPAIPRAVPPPPSSSASVRRTGSAASLGAGTTVVTTTTVGFSVTETTTATTTGGAAGAAPAGFDWAAAAMGGPYAGASTYTFYRPGSPHGGGVPYYYAHHSRRLKRLDFVASCGADLAAMAAAAYRAGRALWPALLAQPLAFVEGRVASAAAPLLAGAAYRAERLLELADAQVDGVVAALGRVGGAALPAPLLKAVGGAPPRPALPPPGAPGAPLDLSTMFALPQAASSSTARQPSPSTAPHLRLAALSGAARALYLDQVRSAAEAVKAVSGAPASARAAADAVVDLLAAAFATTGADASAPAVTGEEADEALARVSDAFAALLATPAVAALLAGPAGGLLAGPPARYARDKYLEAHGALVGSVGYERALSAAAAVLGRVQGSGVYRAAAARLSPLGLEPVLGRVARTPAARAVVQHLRPTGGGGGRGGGGGNSAACPPRGRAETPPAPAAQCAAARG